jgi:hypothetical protein
MERAESYLAVVTELSQIKVHCPVCLYQALSRAVLSAIADSARGPWIMRQLSTALYEVEKALRLLEVVEIEGASRHLLTEIKEGLGEHYDDIPF